MGKRLPCAVGGRAQSHQNGHVCVLFLVAALLSQYRDLYGECSLRPREESSGGRCRGRWATKEHKTVEVHLDVQGVYQNVKPS